MKPTWTLRQAAWLCIELWRRMGGSLKTFKTGHKLPSTLRCERSRPIPRQRPRADQTLRIHAHTPTEATEQQYSRVSASSSQTESDGHVQLQVRCARHATSATVIHNHAAVHVGRHSLIHATDYFKFKPGYLNRRINLTFLFGKRRG